MISLLVSRVTENLLASASDFAADEIVVDLERASAADGEEEALSAVVSALGDTRLGAKRLVVAIHGFDTERAQVELATLGGAEHPPAAIVVPRASPAAISAADVALADASNAVTRLQAAVETADAVARVEQLAGASTRTEALVLGYGNLAVSLGRSAPGAANLDLWLAVQDRVLCAARAWGLAAVDGCHADVEDAPKLERSAARAADLGFDGKWAIHPTQLEAIRSAFAAPTPATRP